MSLKGKIGMALASTALGASLVGSGTFALFTAHAENNGNSFTAGTVNVGTTQGKIFAGTKYFNNMAPGDKETGTLTVTNNGTLDEWVGLEHHLSGGLFDSYLNSVDKNAGWAVIPGNGPGGWTDYFTDIHPLQISYKIEVKDNTNKIIQTINRDPFFSSSDNVGTPFKLLVGQHADITYTYELPLAAHNDYQGKTGQIDVEVDAVQVRNNDGNMGPQSWNPDING